MCWLKTFRKKQSWIAVDLIRGVIVLRGLMAYRCSNDTNFFLFCVNGVRRELTLKNNVLAAAQSVSISARVYIEFSRFCAAQNESGLSLARSTRLSLSERIVDSATLKIWNDTDTRALSPRRKWASLHLDISNRVPDHEIRNKSGSTHLSTRPFFFFPH